MLRDGCMGGCVRGNGDGEEEGGIGRGSSVCMPLSPHASARPLEAAAAASSFPSRPVRVGLSESSACPSQPSSRPFRVSHSHADPVRVAKSPGGVRRLSIMTCVLLGQRGTLLRLMGDVPLRLMGDVPLRAGTVEPATGGGRAGGRAGGRVLHGAHGLGSAVADGLCGPAVLQA